MPFILNAFTSLNIIGWRCVHIDNGNCLRDRISREVTAMTRRAAYFIYL